MRDLAFTLVMVVILPACFVRPWIGILAWSWLGYMNPHRQCYGFAYNYVPWAELVAIFTLAGSITTVRRNRFIWSRETILMFVLWGWFTLTTVFAQFPDDAWLYLDRFSKIILMTLVTIYLIQDRAQMRWLLLVIAGSLGFYGLKAGLFVIATGGNYTVFGAPGKSFVSDNNSIALALNMCLPLFWYLRRDEPYVWVRRLLTATFWLSALAVPFTYSRGGMLGLCVVLATLFSRSRRRFVALPLMVLVLVGLFAFAPEKWVARMQTIQEYEHDESAMGRLTAWGVGFKIANDHPFVGGGFWVFNHKETFAKYAPEYHHFIDAHSIYFNVLGEHGYVGLALFGALVLSTMGSVITVYRVGRRYENLAWVSDYAHMLGASIAAYLVSGAFLSVAYFDLAWHLFALVVVLRAITAKELRALAPARQRVWTPQRPLPYAVPSPQPSPPVLVQ